MSRKNKEDDLDTETTFADMNIDGFSWYNPARKKKDNTKTVKRKISRKEYWQMVFGAFLAYLPYFAIIICVFGVVIGLAYLWLS